ncbi:hypothetical protein J2S74_000685 [Evansella vedderi]|uniref:Alpha glucuronidase N-terminal domain-containing protein n=1 Tax=Evansella vedderi TaxID=38282 RepID=A0ABT9ZS53_9BACI|nr:hypothetical protein [Evansella vedderi]MDQ0253313.1 hypothetical protein [Evansella vedderi]
MKLLFDHNDQIINFGVKHLKSALNERGIHFIEQYEQYTQKLLPTEGIIVKRINKENEFSEMYKEEEFRIYKNNKVIIIEGADSKGVMYGCLEWTERIRCGKHLRQGEEIRQKPALGMRGVKFNLPYAPFEQGDPFLENEKTCLSIDFWYTYIDMLAENRYNCLSLWSEHPFHLMVVSNKFREANPFTNEQIRQNIDFFRNLIKYAKNRGIDVYLFTWNIRLLPEVAKGLGFPESVGDHGNMYDQLIHRVGITLNRFRGKDEIIKDYFREMVLQVLLTYPELKGLGTSASEWMDGTGYEREVWIVDTYVEAIKESGRTVPFIHRTNMQNAGKEIKDLIQPKFDPEDFYISWKYSNAHCYSHPQPQFEKYWNAWEGVDLDKTQILFTVRNDDVFTHRWGDPDYVRSYVKGMLKHYVKGFYWGADGYLWGRDFQHVDYGHKTWKYDFEKHLFQFQLWGRLSYNPNMDDVWEHLLETTYGKKNAGDFLDGLRYASRIIPAVNRLFWIDYDFQWNPESCLSQVTGFKTILDFVEAKPMPEVGVMSIKAFTMAEHKNKLELEMQNYQENPLDIIQILKESTNKVEAIIKKLENSLGDERGSHSSCTLLDLYSWVELGRYYKCKFHAALELNRFDLNSNEEHRNRAVLLLEKAYHHWERLGHYWSQHNKPYFMARVKMNFGYPFYLEDVKDDIEKAKFFGNKREVINYEDKYSIRGE